jgi:copper homeostasis protein CutC
MNVKNIVMENMVLQAKRGLDMTEGSGIVLKNIEFITKEINPVLNIHNSREIILSQIRYRDADLLLNVTGDKTHSILVNGTDVKKAKKGVEVSFGARENAVKVTPL